MADNGHCSECQVQNSTSACGRNAQAFKTIVGSSQVQAHEKYLKLNLDNTPKINQGETIITKEIWDQLTNILQYLKDYGQIAEDNPTQTKIDNTKVNDQNIVLLDKYNAILTALDKDNISPTQLISKDLIDNLKTNINLYQLDAARCDVCNLSGCQVSQCCDSDCDGGGGGGGDPCYGGSGGGWQGHGFSPNNDGSTCYGSLSARIYKENIQDYIQNAVELINSVNIVEFNYKNDPEKNEKIGFIADDTDAQLASKNHNVMDMYNCIGVLLKAVQELSAEIKELKNKNKEE